MKIFVETERLILRDYMESDIHPLVEMNADERVMEYFPKTLSVEESLEVLERIKAEILECGFSFFAVERKEDKKFIGFVGLHKVTFDADFTPAIEIGWRLISEVWGRGYAPEAALGCLEFARKELGLDEVISFTSLFNKKSQRVMEKVGMSFVKEFDHPKVPEGHPLVRHVLYKKVFD